MFTRGSSSWWCQGVQWCQQSFGCVHHQQENIYEQNHSNSLILFRCVGHQQSLRKRQGAGSLLQDEWWRPNRTPENFTVLCWLDFCITCGEPAKSRNSPAPVVLICVGVRQRPCLLWAPVSEQLGGVFPLQGSTWLWCFSQCWCWAQRGGRWAVVFAQPLLLNKSSEVRSDLVLCVSASYWVRFASENCPCLPCLLSISSRRSGVQRANTDSLIFGTLPLKVLTQSCVSDGNSFPAAVWKFLLSLPWSHLAKSPFQEWEITSVLLVGESPSI